MACPLGAHYLPVPGRARRRGDRAARGPRAARRSAGKPVYDERHLCHSPQERLFIAGQWHDGLLPPVEALPAAQRAATSASTAASAAAVARVGAGGRLPHADRARAVDAAARRARCDDLLPAGSTAQGLDAPALRWYLDYCCRDDYGAGAAQVSAWAGLHYFASRHGFHAPGEAAADNDAVADLARRQRLAGRAPGRAAGANACAPAAWCSASTDRASRRRGRRLECRCPAPRTLDRRAGGAGGAAVRRRAPARDAARGARRRPSRRCGTRPGWSPTCTCATPLDDRPGAPPSWDNVVYGSPALGYVDAMHQSTRPHPGPTVLTAYWALGGDSVAQLQAQRRRLLDDSAMTLGAGGRLRPGAGACRPAASASRRWT